MAVEGSLDLFRLPEILQVISQERKTGILTIQGTDDIVAVSFLQGRIVAADALNATTEEALGSVLVEEGRVPEEALRRLAARAEVEGGRLADLLVREGHVDREALLESLRIQTSRLLKSLLEWSRGEFKFYGGEEVSYEEGFRSIGVDEILLAAAEERAQAEPHAVPDLGTRLRRLEGGRPVRPRPAAGLEGAATEVEPDSALWVTPAEQRLLEAVGPGRTVDEVARLAEVPADRARYLLFRFVREGLLAPVSGGDGRPAGGRPAPTAEPAAERPAPAPRRPAPADSAPAAQAAQATRQAARPAARREPAVPRYAAAGLALLAAIVAVVAPAVAPVAFQLPFPWLDAERAALHGERDLAQLHEIDQAAKSFFLLQGRFPDHLDELTALGLLEPGDVVDSRGRRLAYEARERRYVVRPLGRATSEEEEAFHEGIAGDFLLDPDFLAARTPSSAEPPLVLLD